MPFRIMLLILHRLPRARRELPAPGDDDDGRRGRKQHPGADEPAEIAERKVERALPAVEVPASGLEQPRGADHVRYGFRGSAFGDRRHPAEQDLNVIEQPVGPGKFEKGVDEDQDQADAFGFPQRGRGVRSTGSAPSTASASLVERSSASAPPIASRLVEAKNAVPFCSDAMICMSTMRASRRSTFLTHTS